MKKQSQVTFYRTQMPYYAVFAANTNLDPVDVYEEMILHRKLAASEKIDLLSDLKEAEPFSVIEELIETIEEQELPSDLTIVRAYKMIKKAGNGDAFVLSASLL